MTAPVVAIVNGAIRRTDAQLRLALDANERGDTEEVRAQLLGALLGLNELAESLGQR